MQPSLLEPPACHYKSTHAMTDTRETLITAITPLLAAIGGDAVEAAAAESGDIPLEWDGELVGAIRLPPLSHALELLVSRIES